MKNNTILLVDTIKGFGVNGGALASERMNNIITPINKLIEKYMDINLSKSRVILAGDCHDKNDDEFKVFPAHCISGTEETEIIDELSKNFNLSNGLYIPKTKYDAFFDTTLHFELMARDTTTIVICGMCTDICIMITALSALMRNYKVIIPKDCVDTYHIPGTHDAEAVNNWTFKYLDMMGSYVPETLL